MEERLWMSWCQRDMTVDDVSGKAVRAQNINVSSHGTLQVLGSAGRVFLMELNRT
jgi:hypothetical protein